MILCNIHSLMWTKFGFQFWGDCCNGFCGNSERIFLTNGMNCNRKMVTLVESLKRTWIAGIGNSLPQELRARFPAQAFHFAPLRTLPSISTLQCNSSASQKLRTWTQAHILLECGGVSCRAQKQQDGISETENPIPETEGEGAKLD